MRRIGTIGGGATVPPGVPVYTTPVFPAYTGGPFPAPASVSGSGMNVTEVPMQAASWSCGFNPSLPPSIRQDMINGTTERDGFMLVWKGNVPEQGMDYSLSLYAGVVDVCALGDALALSGPSVLAMHGTDDGKIAWRYSTPNTSPTNWFPGGDLEEVTDHWFGYGMTVGNAETTGVYDASPMYVMGLRQAYEKKLLKWNPPTYYEYEIAGCTINVGTPDFLWPDADIDIILSDQLGDLTFGEKRSVNAKASPASIDASQHSGRVLVVGDGTGRGSTVAWGVGSGSGGQDAYSLTGGTRVVSRLVEDPDLVAADETSGLMDDIADQIANRFNNAIQRHAVTVAAGTPVRWWVGPGKKVECWFPNQQVVGSTQSTFAAVPYVPVIERVTRISWTADPTHYTVGWYRSQTGTYTDVTPYLPQSGAATVIDCASGFASRTLTEIVARYGDAALWTRIPG